MMRSMLMSSVSEGIPESVLAAGDNVVFHRHVVHGGVSGDGATTGVGSPAWRGGRGRGSVSGVRVGDDDDPWMVGGGGWLPGQVGGVGCDVGGATGATQPSSVPVMVSRKPRVCVPSSDSEAVLSPASRHSVGVGSVDGEAIRMATDGGSMGGVASRESGASVDEVCSEASARRVVSLVGALGGYVGCEVARGDGMGGGGGGGGRRSAACVYWVVMPVGAS